MLRGNALIWSCAKLHTTNQSTLQCLHYARLHAITYLDTTQLWLFNAQLKMPDLDTVNLLSALQGVFLKLNIGMAITLCLHLHCLIQNLSNIVNFFFHTSGYLTCFYCPVTCAFKDKWNQLTLSLCKVTEGSQWGSQILIVFYLNNLWKGACDEGFSPVQQQNSKRASFAQTKAKKVASHRPYTTKRNNDKKWSRRLA